MPHGDGLDGTVGRCSDRMGPNGQTDQRSSPLVGRVVEVV